MSTQSALRFNCESLTLAERRAAASVAKALNDHTMFKTIMKKFLDMRAAWRKHDRVPEDRLRDYLQASLTKQYDLAKTGPATKRARTGN